MATAELSTLYAAHIERLRSESEKALAESGWDAALVHSGTPKLRIAVDDEMSPFRAAPAFLHWAPLREPDAAVLVVSGRKPVLFRVHAFSFWEKPAPADVEWFRDHFEVVETDAPEKIRLALPRDRWTAFVGEDLKRASLLGFPESACNPQALTSRLDLVRSRKSDYERACIGEANRRAAKGYEAIREAFHAGPVSELDLHLAYLRATGHDDPETPYKNIFALGENGATLHHDKLGRSPCGEADSLLVDAGAAFLGYHSDITRTFVKGETEAAGAFRALIAGMETLQQEMCRRVRPGVAWEALHNQTHDLLAGLVRESGLSSASPEELVASGATRKLLPHGLGHSLGLQTHDVGCRRAGAREERNAVLRAVLTLEAGNVFTVEPGLYFIGPLLEEIRGSDTGKTFDWGLVDRLRPFGGVRIEDDIAVLEGDPANLTRPHLPW